MKSNKLLIVLLVLSIVCYVCFSVCIGLLNRTDSPSTSYNLVVGTGPYNMDTDSIDLETIHKALADIIDVPFTVGIGKNYSHGYPDVIISTKTNTSIDTEKIKSELNKAYPELSIESLNSYSFNRVDHVLIDSNVLIVMSVIAILLVCFFVLIKK